MYMRILLQIKPFLLTVNTITNDTDYEYSGTVRSEQIVIFFMVGIKKYYFISI